jgi:hypothetical protein
MLLKEVRKQFKDIGFKVQIRSYSHGRHANILNSKGEKMPSIFTSKEHREEWLPAIELKSSVGIVLDENSDKIYGFSS